MPRARLRTPLAYNDDAAEMQAVLHDMVVCGYAVELFYTDENGDARYSVSTTMECIVFMNDDLQGDIVGFVRMVKRDKELGGCYVTVYTATTVQGYRRRCTGGADPDHRAERTLRRCACGYVPQRRQPARQF